MEIVLLWEEQEEAKSVPRLVFTAVWKKSFPMIVGQTLLVMDGKMPRTSACSFKTGSSSSTKLRAVRFRRMDKQAATSTRQSLVYHYQSHCSGAEVL